MAALPVPILLLLLSFFPPFPLPSASPSSPFLLLLLLISNFVDDCFLSDDFQKLQIVAGVNTKDDALRVLEYKCSADNPSASLPPARQNPSFNPYTPVPARAQSKRSRMAACNCSSRLVVLSPTTSSSGDAICHHGRTRA